MCKSRSLVAQYVVTNFYIWVEPHPRSGSKDRAQCQAPKSVRPSIGPAFDGFWFHGDRQGEPRGSIWAIFFLLGLQNMVVFRLVSLKTGSEVGTNLT